MQRRDFLQLISSALTFALLTPINALAAVWNKIAFETTQLAVVENGLGINKEEKSQNIVIIAPDKAENGAIVQVEVLSNIADTEEIYIFAEKNPTPLIAHFKFSNGAEPYMVTRIKMAETSDIKVVAKVGSQYFSHTKNVIVLENGCG